MNEWPIDREMDERLQRLVSDEVAAADPRQITIGRQRPRRGSAVGAGLAGLAVVVLVAALAWRHQAAPLGGEPSDTPGATVVATVSQAPDSPSAIPSSEPSSAPSVAATLSPASALTPGPSANAALHSGKNLGCPRYRSLAVTLASGKVLIAGGCMPLDPSASSWSLNSSEIFDPGTGQFKATGDVTADFATATLLKDGRVFFAAGSAGELNQSSGPAALFDPSTGRFVPLGQVVKAQDANSVLLADGRVLIVGGGGTASQPANDSFEIFDPGSGAISNGGARQPADFVPGAPPVLMKDGRVFVTNYGSAADPVLAFEIYDPSARSLTATPSSQASRDGSTVAAALDDGRVMIVGGSQSGIVEAYEPASNSLSRLAPMPKPMDALTATVLKGGQVLVLGLVIGEDQPQYGSTIVGRSGLFDVGPRPTPRAGTLNMTGPFKVTGELYDPASNHWTFLGHLNDERSNFDAVALQDGRALIVGGATDTAEFFDPGTGKFTLNK
jgi:hypothetical protein